MNYNNPAQKLYEFLKEAQTKSTKDSRFRSTWSSIFEINPRDTYSLFKEYGMLVDLYGKTQNLIIESSNDFFDDPEDEKVLNSIKLGLTTVDFEGNMQEFHRYITPEVLVSLRHIARNLSYICKIKNGEIEQEEINNYLSQIESLISDIKGSSLPDDIKAIIYKNLSSLKDSLEYYRFYGIEGIRNALEQSIGSVAMNIDKMSTEKDSPLVLNFMEVIQNLKTSLETITIGAALASPIIKHFLK